MVKEAEVELAKRMMLNEFPSCPICKSNSGYNVEVHWFGRNKITCLSCKATWEAYNLNKGKSLRNLTLRSPPFGIFKDDELRGVEFLDCGNDVNFWRNFDENARTIRANYLGSLRNHLSQTGIVLNTNENVIDAWLGKKCVPEFEIIGDSTFYKFKKIDGALFLTCDRVIWIQLGVYDFDIPLEDLDSFSYVQCKLRDGTAENGVSIKSIKKGVDVLIKLWYWKNIEAGAYPLAFDIIRRTLDSAISVKKNRISKAKAMERVQIILDFTNLREVMEKGGLIMTTFKCPSCNASLTIPQSGETLICQYCNTAIKPVDIFEKIKSLLE